MARQLSDQEKTTLAELRDKHHGRVKPFLVNDHLVVVRAASAGELHRYKDKIGASIAGASGKNRGKGPSIADAERELATSCVVHPEPGAFLVLIEGPDGRAGFIGTAASAAEDLANEGVEELEGN